jgi:hypothetical protein
MKNSISPFVLPLSLCLSAKDMVSQELFRRRILLLLMP